MISIVKENRKDYLLSIFYCCHMPKLLEYLTHIRSIFNDKPISEQITESYLGDTSIETGQNLLQQIFEVEAEQVTRVRDAVEHELDRRDMQCLFEIEESSGEI